MAPRLSGQTSKFGVVFFVSKSLLGIERQKKLKKKIEILTRKPRSHVRILSREEDDYVRHIGKHNLCSVLGPHPLLSNVNREAITNISKIQLVVYHQCCVLIG